MRLADIAAVLDTAPDAMVVADEEGTIRFLNRQAEALFGYRQAEVTGERVELLMPPHVRGRHAALHGSYVRRPATRPMASGQQFSALRADGRTFDAEISLAPMETDEGLLVVAAVRDLTERQQMAAERAELEDLQSKRLESLGRLAGGIAHEFNNLLAVISGYGEFVAEAVSDQPDVAADMAEILGAAERAASLTRQLLIFGQREVIRPEVLDLNEVVRPMEELLRRTLGEHIELDAAFAPDLPPVVADRRGLQQAIVTLAVNARDAMPGGGILSLSTSRVVSGSGDDTACLTVADNGQGMRPEVKVRIFEPFFSTKPKGEGMGLGLTTAQAIISRAGGWIEVDSEEHHGATFRISLPGAVATAPVEEEPDVASRATGGTILVVEDEADVRELAARMLTSHGYGVVTAASPAHALEMCRSGELHPDVLVTDVVMPGLSGPELAATMRADLPDVSVVYMSGYPHEVIADHGELGQGAVLVDKPFTKGALLDAVEVARRHQGNGR